MFKRDEVMPTMLKLYEEAHSKNDKTPVTEVAKETMSFAAMDEDVEHGEMQTNE
ncbi:hypothetical protein SOVF_157250 [Spinacia oleracea]|nr:hypothetical protein SOVF_157250 [Spinacia oleracea]